MNRLWVSTGMALLAVVTAVRADEQVWFEGGTDQIWSTGALNWDAGSAWINGNSARFSGAGETVDVSGSISVSNITFDASGYEIADAGNDGSLTVVGQPSVIEVATAGDTGAVSEAIGGSGGFTKAGAGVLNLTATNTYTGTTTVQSGVLRLYPGVLQGLGATGTGNDTVVASGATIDFNGCYKDNSTSEKFTVSGAGTDGKGVLINTGPGHTNRSLGDTTLADDVVIGGLQRIDIYVVIGNDKTLTKMGSGQLCTKDVRSAEIVINEGRFTILDDDRALGGTTPGDTTVNGGYLDCWNSRTISERITFNGGTLSQGNVSNTFYLTGHLTVNSNVFVNSGGTRGVQISGLIDGPGGFSQIGDGWFIVTGDANTYSGPTIINSGKSLWVGKTNLYAGVLGSGAVTNYGTLFGYSERICHGDIVNYGTLFCQTGVLCDAGSVINTGNLYIDRGGSFVCSNAFLGSGTIFIRYGGEMIMSGSVSSNAQFRMGMGTLTLTNGAEFRCYQEMQIADRLNLNYPVTAPSNLTAVIHVSDGCTLTAQAITVGNGIYGSLTGILNQAGGVVRTTGTAAEGNGIRLGHYPVTYSVYNMMGGVLFVEKDYDLSCATDGKGWFNMTGGEVFATRVMLNERIGTGGYGRLTVAGGVLNVGTLNTEVSSVSNGITVDADGPYLVEYGGAGGVVRAVTNFVSALNATLYGTGTNAITLDTAACAITLSGNLTGEGGLSKTGSGTLTLSGVNTYLGATRILQGSLVRTAPAALPEGGEVLFGITADDAGGRLYAAGDLSLEGLLAGVANPEALDKSKGYTIATYGGALLAGFDGDVLPAPWYVHYDWPNKRVELRSEIGTVLWLR